MADGAGIKLRVNLDTSNVASSVADIGTQMRKAGPVLKKPVEELARMLAEAVDQTTGRTPLQMAERIGKQLEGLGKTYQQALSGDAKAAKEMGAAFADVSDQVARLGHMLNLLANTKVETKEYVDAVAKLERLRSRLQELQGSPGLTDEERERREKAISKEYDKTEALIKGMADGGLVRLGDTEEGKQAMSQLWDAMFAAQDRATKMRVALSDAQKAAEDQAFAAAAAFVVMQDQAEKADEDIIKLAQNLEKLKERQKELEDAGLGLGYAEYDDNATAIREAEQKLKAYRESLQTKETRKSAKVSDSGIADTIRQLQELKARQQALEDAGVGLGHEEYDQNVTAIRKMEAEVQAYRQSLEPVEEELSRMRAMWADIGGVVRAVGVVIGGALKGAMNAVLGIVKSIFNAIKGVVTGVAKLAKTVASKLWSAFKGVLGTAKQLFTSNKSLSGSMSDLIATVKKLAPALLAARGVMGIMRKAVNAYMDANVSVTNQLASCWTSLGNILGPIIQRLVSLVATITSYVMSFLRLLGLVGGSIEAAGSAAGGAAKALKQQLSGLDEIHTWQEDSGGGGGGGSDAAVGLPEVELPEDWVDIADALAKAWAGDAAAWGEVGKMLAQKFNEIVDKMSGEEFQNAAKSLSDKLFGMIELAADFLRDADFTGFFASIFTAIENALTSENFSAEDIGTLLAGKFVLIFSAMQALVESNVIPTAIGNLSGVINGFFQTIREKFADEEHDNGWYNVGYTLGGFIGQIIQGISDLLNGMSWDEIDGDIAAFWEGLKDALKDGDGVNWSGEGGIFDNLFSAFATLGSLLYDHLPEGSGLKWVFGILRGRLTSASSDGSIQWDEIFSALGDTVKGVGILLGSWVAGLTSDPEIKSSWETMKTNLGTSQEGVTWGDILSGFWDTIIAAVTENLPTSEELAPLWTELLNRLAGALGQADWETLKANFVGAFQDIGLAAVEALIVIIGLALAGVTGGVSLIVAAVVGMVVLVVNKWDEIKQAAEEKWESIKETIGGAWDSVSQWTQDTWESVTGWLSGKWESIKQNASELWNGIKTSIQNKLSSLELKIRSIWNAVTSWLSEKWESIKQNAVDIWEGIKGTIQGKIEGARDLVEAAIDAIKGFFNFEWELPPLKLPHLSWGSKPAQGWIASTLEALGLPTSLPTLSVSWYARGGIVDGATLIGAGEDGKEAIVPLERHTQWMDKVAERIVEALRKGLDFELSVRADTSLASFTDRFAAQVDRLEKLADNALLRPLPVPPAIAVGAVVPPRAIRGAVGGAERDATTGRMLAVLESIETRIQALERRDSVQPVTVNVDGRELLQIMLSRGRLTRTQTGRNPFDLGG